MSVEEPSSGLDAYEAHNEYPGIKCQWRKRIALLPPHEADLLTVALGAPHIQTTAISARLAELGVKASKSTVERHRPYRYLSEGERLVDAAGVVLCPSCRT